MATYTTAGAVRRTYNNQRHSFNQRHSAVTLCICCSWGTGNCHARTASLQYHCIECITLECIALECRCCGSGRGRATTLHGQTFYYYYYYKEVCIQTQLPQLVTNNTSESPISLHMPKRCWGCVDQVAMGPIAVQLTGPLLLQEIQSCKANVLYRKA